MTQALTDYTSYAEVRAILGTNVDELEDATLGLDVYVNALEFELAAAGEKVVSGADLVADYVAAAALASPTVAEARLVAAVKLLAPYAVALQMASSLPQFSPKSITGEKVGFIRHADSYKVTLDECFKNFGKYLSNLEAVYGVFKSASVSTSARAYLGVSSPLTDPVAG